MYFDSDAESDVIEYTLDDSLGAKKCNTFLAQEIQYMNFYVLNMFKVKLWVKQYQKV